MPVFDQDFVNGVGAAAAILARTTAETLSSTTSATSTSGTGSSTTTSSASSESTTGSSGDGGGSGGNGNSPLLFFVALGFGVVFTNLWIIVGVKYCFRYNARNRQMRGLDENGEPINLENMPTRPHRRRREKKLMTMDEVNEKFPMVKYKTWVSERAREGLPTAGGVSVNPSRANSIRSADGIVPDLHSKERESSEEVRATPPSTADDNRTPGVVADNNDRASNLGSVSTTNTHDHDNNDRAHSNRNSVDGRQNDASNDRAPETPQTDTTVAATESNRRSSHDDDDDDDEQINAALPPELAGAPGDTCAICIDTLEDDDDVRGLTCGHAFHAVCLDPWLTNRRACCPLCKADYYTPKPRPAQAEGDAANNASDPSRNNDRMNLPRTPQRTFGGFVIRGPTNGSNSRIVMMPGRWGGPRVISTENPRGSSRHERSHRSRREGRDTSSRNTTQQTTTSGDATTESTGGGWFSRVRERIPQLSSRNDGNTPADANTNANSDGNANTTTPSQLEAGTRSDPNAAARTN